MTVKPDSPTGTDRHGGTDRQGRTPDAGPKATAAAGAGAADATATPARAAPPWRRFVLSSLVGYRRAWLALDLLAGVTLAAIVVPEQLATAHLAGMPVATGLYAFVAAAALFALLGSSPQLSVGADSTIAPVMAAGVAVVATTGTAAYTGDMALLALLVGIIVVIVGLARMGWVAAFFSVPVVTGFLAGIAVTIIASQLAAVLGLPSVSGNALQKVVRTLQEIGQANGYAIAVAVASFVVIVVGHRIGPRMPGALIALVASAVASEAFDLASHGVATVGSFTAGLPPLQAPPFSATLIWQLLPTAFAVALIVITQTSVTTRSFAELGGYDVDVDRDFIGTGAGSVLAAFFGAFAVNASPPRTAILRSSGGRTQVPGLVAAALVLVVLAVASGLLAALPEATLGAVLIYIALRIFRTRDLAAILRFDRREFVIAIATLTTVVVLGVGPGILLAVLFAILDRTWRSAHPHDAVLGRLPGTTVWWSLKERPDGETMPGVLCYRFDAGLYFANAQRFRERVLELVTTTKPTPRLFVLDASGVEDLDYTGARVLLLVVHELHEQGVDFAVARATGETPRDATQAGLLRHIGKDHLFLTVDEAVRTLAPHGPPPAFRRRRSREA
ncbi:MAG TPA: SulP family inorganic anion transporter [Thermoleophilia bacterium]|nr:SulP family inorganic anion transporter [Thermoleophilia bacterium]